MAGLIYVQMNWNMGIWRLKHSWDIYMGRVYLPIYLQISSACFVISTTLPEITARFLTPTAAAAQISQWLIKTHPQVGYWRRESTVITSPLCSSFSSCQHVPCQHIYIQLGLSDCLLCWPSFSPCVYSCTEDIRKLRLKVQLKFRCHILWAGRLFITEGTCNV